MGIIVAPLALVLLATGITLLVRGLRGVAVDDHPVCRRCRFDLVGLPKTSARCSECGADLSVPHAIFAGNRRRRPGLIAAGVVVLLPCLAGLVLLTVMTVSNVAWIEYAPQWYVMWQARGATAAVHDPALAELSRRLASSLMSDGQVAVVVDAGLELQADRSATWVPAWGDLIESARTAGKVPDEKWHQYLKNAPDYTLAVRPEVRRGDKLILQLRQAPSRVGKNSRLWARTNFTCQPDSDLIARSQLAEQSSNNNTLSTFGGGSVGHYLSLDPALVAKALDGPKNLHIKVSTGIYVTQPLSEKAIADVTTTQDLSSPWTLVPADAPTVRAVDDPSARPAVEAGIQVQELTLRFSPTYPQIMIKIGKLPVPIAYRVILRAGDREWQAGQIYAPANSSTTWGTGGEAKGLTAGRVDVVLRPDPTVAAETVDMHDYWNGEVVIKDVAVQRPDKSK